MTIENKNPYNSYKCHFRTSHVEIQKIKKASVFIPDIHIDVKAESKEKEEKKSR